MSGWAIVRGNNIPGTNSTRIVSLSNPLVGLIFSHRLEIAAGSDSIESILKDCVAEPLERLARFTMRR